MITNYEIQFGKIVRFNKGKSLMILDVPISHIFQDPIVPEHITVIIDSGWGAANFDTIVDNVEDIWLFAFNKKDMVIKKLKKLERL